MSSKTNTPSNPHHEEEEDDDDETAFSPEDGEGKYDAASNLNTFAYNKSMRESLRCGGRTTRSRKKSRKARGAIVKE